MEIRVLEYFLAVARLNSFSKAAEALHLTQPTLSRQIKELEETYHKQFFVRHSRCVCLTEDGLLFKKRAEEIISLVNKTEEEMSCDSSKLAGEIRLGSVATDGFAFIGDIISDMQKTHPDIKIRLYTGNNQQIKEKLDAGLLDLALVIEPVDLTAYDFLRIPYYDSWGVWMKEDQALSHLNSITSSDLRQVSVLLSDCEMVKNQIAGWIGGNQRALNVKGTYDLIDNATCLVKDNTYLLGLHFNNLPHLTFKPLSPPLQVGLDIIWPKYKACSKIVECFLDKLQEAIHHI